MTVRVDQIAAARAVMKARRCSMMSTTFNVGLVCPTCRLPMTMHRSFDESADPGVMRGLDRRLARLARVDRRRRWTRRVLIVLACAGVVFLGYVFGVAVGW